MSKKFIVLLISLVSYFFIGWGGDGHYIINYNSVYSLPSNADFLISWQNTLAEHGSDADYRKGDDPTEAPKHYIDIDNYPEFVNFGYISHDIDSLIEKYGEDFVIDQGTLPWAIINTYNNLKTALINYQWNQAELLAADLGHYIGDASMPLHITKNYNGQLTGQYGIHSRYESKMIGQYVDSLTFSNDSAFVINDLSDYVFNFIYNNYPYVDTLLAADKTAKTGLSSYNTTYYKRLWNLTKEFTILMLKRSSDGLASLMYSAWIEAGSPTPTSMDENLTNNDFSFLVVNNYPNPFNGTTTINYYLPKSSKVKFQVFDVLGNLVKSEDLGYANKGQNHIHFYAESNLSSGTYIFRLETEYSTKTGKLILLK